MATKTAGANVGNKSMSGKRAAVSAPVTATADLTVTYDDTRITTRADFLAACTALSKQLFSV